MAFDGILLNCVINELEEKILNGRIDKIYQPEKDEIIILIRNKGSNYRLLLSANPNNSRMHLTQISKDNPLSAPMFCMLLRKHLLGGRIINIEQPQFERIAVIHVKNKDELGDLTVKKLIIEIMGRHSNIILVDKTNKILDSIKHVSQEMSRVRQVLPGKQYIFPPSQGKQNPLAQDFGSVLEFIESSNTAQKPDKLISSGFTGISRVSAREIVFRAIGQKECSIKSLSPEEKSKLASSFIDFFEMIKTKNFHPCILKDDQERLIDVFPVLFYHYPLDYQKHFASISEALDLFYRERDKKDRMKQLSSNLFRVLNTNLERAQNKLGVLLEEMRDAEKAETYKLWGELITANIYNIPKGAEEVQLVNYYDENGATVSIPMDPKKSPAQNAQAYFKKYNKAKNAIEMVGKQIKETREEIIYIENQLHNLEKCTDEADIEEIREELIKEGYIKNNSRKKRPPKPTPSKPHHFISSDGFDIFVGKNNAQNDRLTLKTASSEDIWMHTKDVPGSHVIIKTQGRSIPDSTLYEGAMLAAYFSKARTSSNVAVDYCPRKNVKKPRGARPGMVIYENYNTIYVTPSEAEIGKMRKV